MESQLGEGASVGVEGTRLEELAPEPLLTRDYETRPSLVYERLRQQHGPVAPVDLLGVPAWLVLGYREALQVLQDDGGWPKGLENWRARTDGEVPADWPLGPSLEVNHVLIQGGPGYGSLRTAWDAALKPFQDPGRPQAKRLKAAVTAYADELITLVGQGGGTGVADLSAQFSRPLPLMVASHLLGFPGSQGDDALMDMWRVLDAGPDAEPALERLLATLAELAAVKLEKPGDDFPSHLLAAYPGLSLDELARELFMLLGMVSDHVGILMSNTVVEVISGDGGGVRASLSAGMIRETMNRVVMRKPPLVNFVPRFAAEDTPLGNYTIRAGDPVWVSAAAAHADPLFADHVASGSTISTRAHLSWGAGPASARPGSSPRRSPPSAWAGSSSGSPIWSSRSPPINCRGAPRRSCAACARCRYGTNSSRGPRPDRPRPCRRRRSRRLPSRCCPTGPPGSARRCGATSRG